MTVFFYYLASLIAVICVFVPHEFAHAFVANKCGDGTAKVCGRLTLNPVKHIDPMGFVMCFLTGFGWAKPVPINPFNFRNYKRGLFLTAIAGVAINYIIAFCAYPVFLSVDLYTNVTDNLGLYFVYMVFLLIYSYSLSVFIFNLLPFYPLDGFRVVEAFTREVNPVRRFLKNYGRYILLILVLESFLCGILEEYTSIPYVKYFDILGYVHWFAQNIIGFPITAIWNAVFGQPIGLAPY